MFGLNGSKPDAGIFTSDLGKIEATSTGQKPIHPKGNLSTIQNTPTRQKSLWPSGRLVKTCLEVNKKPNPT